MPTFEVGMFRGNNADTSAMKAQGLKLFTSNRSNSFFPVFFADSTPLNDELPSATGRPMV